MFLINFSKPMQSKEVQSLSRLAASEWATKNSAHSIRKEIEKGKKKGTHP
jgi:hypothetical protein